MIHLDVGGSSAVRTINCPGWLALKKKHNPTNRSNVAADVGNLLHDTMENLYQHGTSFADQMGVTTYAGIVLEEDHLPLLDSAKAMIESLFDEYNIEEFLCEPFVQYQEGYIGGSIDMVGVSALRRSALFADYKFGRGKADAEIQLMFYIMCALVDPATKAMLSDVEEFTLATIQPVCSDTPVVVHKTRADIAEFEKTLLAALKTDHTEIGKHCQYCPVAPYCPEKNKQALKALVLSKSSAKCLGQSWQLAQELKAWIKSVDEECDAKLTAGADIPDLKMVAGRNSKKWTVEDRQLVDIFGMDIVESKSITLSPAQAIKKFGKKPVMEWVQEIPQKSKVVHVDDDRPALVIDPEDKFKNFLESAE